MTAPHGWVPDPGLAVERTALAWRRTALSAAVAFAVLAHAALDSRTARLAATATTTAAVVLAVTALACALRARALRARRPRPLGAMVATTSAAVTICATATTLGLNL